MLHWLCWSLYFLIMVWYKLVMQGFWVAYHRMSHLLLVLQLFPVDQDSHNFFCRLHSNVFDVASLFQTNHVVHWNAPREDIFLCVASWLFRITWSSFTTSLSSRGKLTTLFIVSNASKKPLWICPDHILSSADKQRPRWQFYGRQKAR